MSGADGRETLVGANLAMNYGDEVALRDVSVTLEPGAAPLGVIGPSGSGKTTLVRLLMGWRRPTGGTVRFGNQDPAKPAFSAKRRVKAGLRGVHEERDPLLDPRAKAGRYLDRALDLARRTGRDSGLRRGELLDLVGLRAPALERFPRQISLGEQQRLTLAAALATDPDVLILDEPSTALDPASTLSVLGRVVEHATGRGTALLVVSHDLGLISRCAAEVIALVDGEQVARGGLDEILDAANHPYLAELAAIRDAESRTRRPAPRHPRGTPFTREDLRGGGGR